MQRKYLNQGIGLSIDFSNTKKWQDTGKGTLKLLDPNYDTDKLFTDGHFKIVTKAEDTEENEKPEEKPTERKVYINGIANANIIDRVNERVDPRGLELENFLKNPQLLAHHNYYCPIGQVEELSIEDSGITFVAWVGDPQKAELTNDQKEIRSLVKQGILKTVSVGFIPKEIQRPTYGENGEIIEPLVIVKWELLELSIVAIPCNQDSVFTESEKSIKELDMTVKVTDKTTTKKDGEDSELKTVLSEIKTVLSSLSSDMKSVVTASQDIVKKLDAKAAPMEEEEEEEEKGNKKPKEEEEEDKKGIKDILAALKKSEERVEQIAQALVIVSKQVAEKK